MMVILLPSYMHVYDSTSFQLVFVCIIGALVEMHITRQQNHRHRIWGWSNYRIRPQTASETSDHIGVSCTVGPQM